MREESLIRKVKTLTEGYSFNQPFSNYLKEHFKNHPEMGARDRRETRGWSFNLFRIGVNLRDLPFEKRLAVACFLCSETNYPSLAYLLKNHSEFQEADLEKSLEEKIKIVIEKYPDFKLENIFQMSDHLSPKILNDDWYKSFLKKPRVWIRIRKMFRDKVLAELKNKKIDFISDTNPYILSFQPEISLEKTDSYQNGFFEIQDKSSQRTLEFFNSRPGEFWWDACAGSGGKSLMLKDENPDIKLFVTDVRPNILEAFSERFKKSGYRSFQSEIADLSSPDFKYTGRPFDGIIADVPCTGSGTWSRSPEWLQKNIEPRLINHFIPLQRSIVMNVLPYLKAGFPLVYITCSVFKEENEENINYFLDQLPLKLEKSTYLEGYSSGSDTLFVARFSKLS